MISDTKLDEKRNEQASSARRDPRVAERFQAHAVDTFKWLAGRAGVALHALAGSRAAGRAGILVYHRVVHRVPGVPEPTINVSPPQFRRQLAGLLDRGYTIWPLRKLLAQRERGEPLPPRTMVVTFDDGYENVYTEAWPILCELQVPATVFVNTAFLERDEPMPYDQWGVAVHADVPSAAYRPLTTAQCREMIDSGLVEIGSHTHAHGDFRNRGEELKLDLELSRAALQHRLEIAPCTFAFPYGRPHLGYAGGELARAAREAGMLCALTTEAVLVDPRSDPFEWGRFNAYQWDSAATLAAKLNGWYGWAPRLQERLAGLRRRRLFTRPGCGSAVAAEGNS